MSQAIVTKYYGPGNVRGSRIVAKCEAGRVSIPYPHELSGEDVHRAAAVALCDKLNADARKRHPEAGPEYMHWNPAELVGGGLPDESGYAFVLCQEVRRWDWGWGVETVFPPKRANFTSAGYISNS